MRSLLTLDIALKFCFFHHNVWTCKSNLSCQCKVHANTADTLTDTQTQLKVPFQTYSPLVKTCISEAVKSNMRCVQIQFCISSISSPSTFTKLSPGYTVTVKNIRKKVEKLEIEIAA